jgi:copper chaperone CopZ
MSVVDSVLDAPHAVTCAHCGLDVPEGLVPHDASRAFCCGGCATAWEVLHASGLDQYYALSRRREARVETSGRSFEEFDHEAFAERYVRTRPDGLAEADLYLEGVHCPSCVWLVERVPTAVTGMAAAELDLTRGRVRVAWDPAQVKLSTVARFLDTLGYRPHPFRGGRAEAQRRREDRAMLVRIGVAGALAANTMLAALALYSGWFSGMERDWTRYFRIVSLILAGPALFGPGRVFLRRRVGFPAHAHAAHGRAGGDRARARPSCAACTTRSPGTVRCTSMASRCWCSCCSWAASCSSAPARSAADSAELLYGLCAGLGAFA